jgi:acetyl esterase/lipase
MQGTFSERHGLIGSSILEQVLPRDKQGTDKAIGRMSKRRWLALGFAVALLILAVTNTHVRTGIKSAFFLVEILPDSPVYPGRLVSDEPQRLLIQFPSDERAEGALLFQPPDRTCHAAIVMVIGLGPEYDDRHLDRLARAFARNGIIVVIPIIDSMVDYRLDGDEHRIAVSAYRYLARRADVHPERIGMFGISVGGAVVVNAAQQPETRENLAMVHSLGGYFDATRVLTQMSVQAFEIDGEWAAWEPSSTTYRATRNSLVPLMPSEDRGVLWDLFSPDAHEVPEDIQPEDSLALARLLTNREPSRAFELADSLPEDLVEFLAGISPSTGIDHLQTDVLLLHDQNDHVLPYSESIAFADALSERDHDNVALTILEQFHHVRPDEESTAREQLADGWLLYRHIYRMHRSLDSDGWFVSPLESLPGIGGRSSCGETRS